jgi:RNA polymerase sigma factor (sigma-70 family)
MLDSSMVGKGVTPLYTAGVEIWMRPHPDFRFLRIGLMSLDFVLNCSAFDIIPSMKSVDALPAPPPDIVQESQDRLAGLIAAIAKGDEQALGAFYDAAVSRVFGLALRIVRQHGAAEEVAEDVFIQVWQQAGRFDSSRGKPLTWLLTICRSRALDYLRRQDQAISHPEPETLAAEPDDERADPQDILLAIERNSRLYAILEQLLPIQRQLLALAFFRGLTHQEIADHTQLPLGTVKSHVRKALDRMREQLVEIS